MSIKQNTKKKKTNKIFIRLVYISLLLILVAAYVGQSYYKRIYAPCVVVEQGKELFLIPTGSDFEDVLIALEDGGYLSDVDGFKWVAKQKSFTTVKPGRYKLKHNWTNNDLVNTLRSGNQSPVRVTFNNIRTMAELAGAVSIYLECDSLTLLKTLNDEASFKNYGFDKASAPGLFIPNTYEFWWNTSPEAFIKRMHKEYLKFWTSKRLEQAKQIGLEPKEVSALAAIVDEETIKTDEKPDVAGLYINRLNKNMRLQADPTVKYAIGDFSIQRVLTKDLKTPSPYNTYLHAGLPPGPIRVPSVTGLEAVLNHTQHKYLYMCAKEDFSGYHNFAKTLKQHNANAAKFQRALNSNRIYR
ncbi:endolytic transglycosylase MltG [Carboxylicivirga sp. M1479]|uniref:endolytic transglycosylase MltG n=1 Tax=Carboxylicivirga sp. M1479 TaxID=2594476 RepID=UPI0011777792|nr:endolytic transglycosylase MltG [Carboxylicivirga sp. M1479]TRX63258.1 endolytic transglycosylase MltG [Carboxylicivirga sp. M1479]